MKRAAWIPLLVLVVASLACSLAGAGAKSPTLIPTPFLPKITQPVVISSPTVKLLPTEPAATAEPASTPNSTIPTVPAANIPVLILADQTINASSIGSFTVVDSSTGAPIKKFSVTGISPQGQTMAVGQFVFYVDATSNMIRRAGADGSNSEMPFTNNTEKPFIGIYLPSPDGQRIAWGNADQSTAGKLQAILKVANVDGSNPKTLVDEIRDLPSRPEPVHWSADGKSLYFTNAPYGIGGYILFYGWSDLQKFDLETGKITEILPNLHCLCAGALSPDETRVAYLNRPEADYLELMVMDISSGNKTKIKLPVNHLQAGGIVWSPDGQSLLITAAFGNPSDEATTILKIDPTTGSLSTVIPDDKRVLQTVAWPVSNVVWLKDINGQAWRLDPSNGKLEQAGQGQHLLLSEPR